MKIGIVNDTSSEKHYGCATVMANLMHLLKSKAQIIWTWPVNKDWRQHRHLFDALAPVDAVIVNGEGTIHHSEERSQAHALAEIARHIRKTRQIPSYLINATLEQNEASLYRALSNYKLIFVRDTASQREAQCHGVSSHYVPDLTFARRLTETPAQEQKRSAVMCSSVLREVRKPMRSIARGRGMKELSILDHRQAPSFFRKKPHKYLSNAYKWLKMGNKGGSHVEFARQIATSSFVFTGRYHAVTLCLKYQTPFLAVRSNTSKIHNLLVDALGTGEREFTLSSLAPSHFEDLIHFSSSELQKIQNFCTTAEHSIQKMLETLIDDIREERPDLHEAPSPTP